MSISVYAVDNLSVVRVEPGRGGDVEVVERVGDVVGEQRAGGVQPSNAMLAMTFVHKVAFYAICD